jgi:general nucleoside transport system permease protein
MKKFFAHAFVREFMRIFLAIFISLVLGFIITLFVSKDPIGAYKAFLFGPVSKLNRFGEWIKESITLCLLGLSVAIVFKANLFSMGAEGQMVIGALVSGAVALFVPLPIYLRIPLALLVAMIAGFLIGLLPGYLKAELNANEIVSTLMINAICDRIYDYTLITYIKPPTAGYNVSANFPVEGALPNFVPHLPFLMKFATLMTRQANITIMLYIAIIAVLIVYFIMFRTPFGYELRMVGTNMKFARYGGIDTKKTIMLTMALGGVFAGLAGAHLAMGVNQKLISNITISLGFEGIVVALLARNNPVAVPFAALAYGYLRAGATIMELTSDVPYEMVMVIQALIILLVTAEGILPMVQQQINNRKEEAAEPVAEGGADA